MITKSKTIIGSISDVEATTYAKYEEALFKPTEPYPELDTRQYILIRKDLHMRLGKAAVQAARACDAIMCDYRQGPSDPEVETWLYDGINKRITLYIESEEMLKYFMNLAEIRKWRYAVATDIGLTEFKGVSTLTCVVIGPHDIATLSPYFDNLKLA